MIAFVLGDMAGGTLSRCSSGILRTWHATAYLARILAGVVSVAKLLFVSLLSALSAFSEVAETAAMCTMCHGLLRCSSAAVGVVTAAVGFVTTVVVAAAVVIAAAAGVITVAVVVVIAAVVIVTAAVFIVTTAVVNVVNKRHIKTHILNVQWGNTVLKVNFK